MADATQGTIVCKLCAQPVPLRFQRASEAGASRVLLLILDTKPLSDHMSECTGTASGELAAGVPKGELAGRIHQILDRRMFVAKGGSRACTMCGMVGSTCMAALKSANMPCCTACRDGNTHPAPGEAKGSCAEWAAENAAQD